MKLYKKKASHSYTGDLLQFIILLLIGIFMAFPLVYTIGNAFKPLDEFWVFPPHIFPRRPTFQNFRDLSRLTADSVVPFSRYIFNTTFITVVGTVGTVILASMCAYPLAKRDFFGRRVISQAITLALMFNATVTAIPVYLIMTRLQMIDTYWALIIPACGSPLGLFLMKQFMEQMVPDTLLEAAEIDGARQSTIFWRIIFPIVKPAWLTLIMFSVQGLWATGYSTTIFSEHLKTLSFVLSQIGSSGVARAGVSGAAGLITMSVPIGVFLFTQSNIIETMSTSGMKE